MHKTLITTTIVLALMLLGAVGYILVQKQNAVQSYEQCVSRGYPVEGSNPPFCTTPDGYKFANPASSSSETSGKTSISPNNYNSDGKALQVVVRFSKEPKSSDDFTYTEPVTRTTARKDMGTFTIEQLILGPNETERTKGLYSPLHGKLEGSSSCAGKDFKLTVDNGKAKLQFCRTIISAGIGDDARIKETVTQTLKQFLTVKDVVIVTKDNNCFGDMSGENRCLED